MRDKSNRRGRAMVERYARILSALTTVMRPLPPVLKGLIWRLSDMVPGDSGAAIRYILAKTLASVCGSNVYFGQDVEIRGWSNLSFGNNVSINRTCYLDATGAAISIGSDVSIAHQTTLISTEHTWSDETIAIKDNPCRSMPIVIADDVWIAAGCRILAGVSIGSRAVVAAGAVVTKDVAPRTVVGGVPARVLRSL